MNKLILFTLLLTSLLFPQLKEMEVKPTENRGGIPILRDYPDKAAVILYTQYDNLTFYSSYGIHNVMGDPASGKYIVIIEPAKQSLEVRSPGHKSEIIKIESLQPRDVLYYEVLPKKDQGFQGVSEVGVTFQVTPSDATILLDSLPTPNNQTTKVSIGVHSLSISKKGYEKYNGDINITPENTFFKIDLSALQLTEVTINSEPEGAEIYIDENSYGLTSKTFFLFPGEYSVMLTKGGYLSYSGKLIVSKDKAQNNFKFNLVKSSGFVEILANPRNSTISLNKKIIENGVRHEVPPGIYFLEVERDGYRSFSENITVELGKTTSDTVNLIPRTGSLQFTVNPVETECILSKDGVLIEEWKGLKIFPTLPIGSYLLSAKIKGYKSAQRTIQIDEGQTRIEEISMEKENYIPLNLAEKQIQMTGDQNVKLISFSQNGETELVVSYDLAGIEGDDYEVEFFLRRKDDPGFRKSFDEVRGDIGDIEFIKGKKQFVVMLRDSEIFRYPNRDYYFELEVNKLGGGIAWYYYVAGGALLGGTAAAIILTSGNNTEEAPFVIGAPPIRP